MRRAENGDVKKFVTAWKASVLVQSQRSHVTGITHLLNYPWETEIWRDHFTVGYAPGSWRYHYLIDFVADTSTRQHYLVFWPQFIPQVQSVSCFAKPNFNNTKNYVLKSGLQSVLLSTSYNAHVMSNLVKDRKNYSSAAATELLW